MNSVFSFKRFWTYLKRDAVLNAKYMIVPAAIMGLLTVVYLCLWSSGSSEASYFGVFTTMCAAMIMVSFMPSQISKDFKAKTSCTDFLTAPASMLEKYVAKIFKHIVLPMLWAAIAVKFCLVYSDNRAPDYLFTTMVDCGLWISGFFLFWGTMFRRLAIIVGMAVITGIALLIRSLVYAPVSFLWLDPLRVYIESFDENSKVNLFTIVSVLFFVLNVVAGYFIYRRKQLNVKLLNW